MKPMRQRSTGWFSVGLFLTVALLAVTPLVACSVPVFRYALERWRSDDYHVTIFHRGSFTTEQRALVDVLGPEGRAGKEFSNLKLETVDLDADPDEKLLKLWEEHQSETLPWMVLDYPLPLPAAWSGPLTEQNVDRLLDSPLRREIARRVLKGETAVWVMLEGGDKITDDETFNRLSTELALAGLNLKLPEIEEQDIADGLVSIEPDELKIAFSALRVSRDDPAEQMLIEMLLGSEGGGQDSLRDPEFAEEPMAFPVFGRGRVLYALVGAGINEEMIGKTCQELIGPCTCEVKGDNPGVDLVMSVNWDNLVESQIDIDTELPPVTGLGNFSQTNTNKDEFLAVGNSDNPITKNPTPDEATKRPGGSAETSEASAETKNDTRVTDGNPAEAEGISSVLRNTLILIGLTAAVVIGASLVLMRKG